MSRIKSWDEIVDKMVDRLSKWKMKTLSIGGRLTLLKAVLGSMPIYHMSIFKVPMKVLQRMESIRSRVIKVIHGEDGKNGSGFKVGYKSIWRSILQEWHGDMVLKQRYPRLYALEVKKTVDVLLNYTGELDLVFSP
ncbi:hypothetical protein Tco_1500719 [Tanacetum coccineum]